MAVVGNGDKCAVVSRGKRRDAVGYVCRVEQLKHLEALGSGLLGLWLRGRSVGRCAAASKCGYAT
jgi:hypothetical protein